jgi:hypothetical protein
MTVDAKACGFDIPVSGAAILSFCITTKNRNAVGRHYDAGRAKQAAQARQGNSSRPNSVLMTFFGDANDLGTAGRPHMDAHTVSSSHEFTLEPTLKNPAAMIFQRIEQNDAR